MSYKVYLKKNEEKRLQRGHPWVYANEVQRIEGAGKNGDLAAVYSSEGRFIGKGFINHLSKIIVRIFIRDEAAVPDEAFFTERIKAAKSFRERTGIADEDCYRAVFGESDDLPGLVADKYGDVLSVQILTLGMDLRRDIIVKALANVFKPRGIYLRNDSQAASKEGLKPSKGPVFGDPGPVVQITENGLKMRVNVAEGQKTGYFLDQKYNRLAVRKYAKGADVLDCFSNVGGFSINAAAGGAKSVTAVDISPSAIAEVMENAALNGFSDVVSGVTGDVFQILREYKNEDRRFDLVILDPPAFCKSRGDVKDALRGYRDVNLLGMKLTAPGGFLVTSSCSHFISVAQFENMLKEAAEWSGRRVRQVEMRSQAPDHAPLIIEDESSYLKFFVLSVE